MLVRDRIQGMAIGSSSSFRAESTREIEDQTSHQNNADCSSAEHRAATVKSPSNEQRAKHSQKVDIFMGLLINAFFARASLIITDHGRAKYLPVFCS